MNTTKVLMVDDDTNLLAMLKKALTAKSRADVRTESDPKRVVQVAGQFRPDIVILDIDMPGMDGGDVAHALNGNALTKDTPIIFLTTLSTQTEARGRQGATAEEYIVAKPVDTVELVRHIEKRLGRKI